MANIFIVTLLSIAYGQLSRDEYYANWMGAMSDNSAATAFNGDIQTSRLIDIVLPGSHHAGMYEAAITDNNYLFSTDTYYTNILAYSDTGNKDRITSWSKRQIGSIEDQLNAGSRFLDLRLEDKGGVVYAHNGLLGATLDTILTDINSYLDASDKTDIIVLSFNDFLGIADPDTVFGTVYTELSSYIADTSTYSISNEDIASLLAKNINVIPIFDGTTSSAYVLDSTEARLTGTESNTAVGTEVISSVISDLVSGWDTSTATGQMNSIYYVLNIDEFSEYTKYSNLYASYQAYSAAELAITLSNTILNYPKLYFGNAILVDFVQSSSVTDQVIALNYNYLSCRDPVENWGDAMDCYTLTDLSRGYKDSAVTDLCTITTSLSTDCMRSCGECTWIDGVPGATCAEDTDCASGIYSGTGTTGECFVRDDAWSSFIKEAAFCLAAFSNAECGTISSDNCNGVADTIAGCTEFCSSDYQCVSGYCDVASAVCLGISTPAPTTTTETTECYCPFVVSEGARDFREDIKGFRPGDPNGEYEFVGGQCSSPADCNSMLDENPYVKSLIGFIVMPFTFAIIMFILYCCCCMCWCTCTTFWKKKCCRCCLGEPETSLPARYAPTVIMAAVLIVLLWASIEGIMANGEMHDHIFAEHDISVRTETLNLFDTVIDKFEGIGPDAEWVATNVKKILGSVGGILDKVESGTGPEIAAIYDALNKIAYRYDAFSITVNVSTPFNPIQTKTVVLPCDYCGGLGAQISDINDTFKSAISIVSSLQNMLNNTGGLVDAETAIDDAVAMFNQIVDNFTSQIATYRNDTEAYLDDFEGYDEQRQQAMSAFFFLPIIWIVLWIIGLVMGIIKKLGTIGECCFKCTWCQAMFIGATVMLIFSFFSIIAVGWADLCYNLDEFEADPEGSTLGQTIASLSGNASGGFDPVDIVNACWTGSDLMETFNLTDKLVWNTYRDNLTSVLDIDITKELTIDALDEFVAEINLLSTDEFEVQGDTAIAQLNAVGGSCVCECTGPAAWGTTDAEFTRTKIDAGECHDDVADAIGPCWVTGSVQNIQNCVGNFTLVYTYLQAETALVTDTGAVIADIKNLTAQILQAYDGIFAVAVDIENSVQNISCSIDPMFEKFDALIKNYSNCGFLGELYGGFKDVGCVVLFGDMYLISRSMMVIAFISILAVIFGFMSEYSWHPVKEDEEDDVHDIGSKLVKSASMRFGKTQAGKHFAQTSIGRQLSQRGLPGFEDTEAEMTSGLDGDDVPEGGGNDASEGGGSAQPAPPESAPPETAAAPLVADDGALTAPQNDQPPQPQSANQDFAPAAPTDFDADTTQQGDVL